MLADVLEKFVSTSLNYFNLDPWHYFSAPGFSWDAILKKVKVELEKISDQDKYIFIEKGTRGGISYISKRYSKANNEYYSDCDSEKPKTCISYLDINNSYEHAMSQSLPHANSKWVKNINEVEQKLMEIKSNSSTEYMLEVDLEYPKNLHYEYNDYPLAPGKLLFNYCLLIVWKLQMNIILVQEQPKI